MSEVTDQHLSLLGKLLRDCVTGFQGRGTSVSFDLYGCVQVAISPAVDKEGKIPEGRWCDVNRVQVVEHLPCMPVPQWVTSPPGPAEKPTQAA